MAPRAVAKPKHSDGTSCPEGTRSVPRGFQPCCAAFSGHVETCYADLRYEWWPRRGAWVVILPSGGSGIEIGFCPHCGGALTGAPPKRRTKATPKASGGRRATTKRA